MSLGVNQLERQGNMQYWRGDLIAILIQVIIFFLFLSYMRFLRSNMILDFPLVSNPPSLSFKKEVFLADLKLDLLPSFVLIDSVILFPSHSSMLCC